MRKLLYALLLFCSSFFNSISTFAFKNQLPQEEQFKQLDWDRSVIRYDLNQIISSTEDSISKYGKVIIPHDATDYERLLFKARRIQHNDSQLVAVKFIRYLLEFEYFRTPGEELYIQLLLSNSLDYIGAPLIANTYLNKVFPDILDHINREDIKAEYLSHYGGILVKIDSLERAKEVYKNIIEIGNKINDTNLLISARNNYGFVLKLLHQYDSSEHYFILNQEEYVKTINPTLHAFAFGNYGAVLLEKGMLDSAIFYTKKEVSLLRSENITEGLANAYKTLGEAYIKLKNLDSAGYYFKLSLNVSERTDRLSQIIENYESLLQLYALKEDDARLKEFLKNYFSYNDSLKSILSFRSYSDELRVAQFMQIINEAQLSKKNFDQLEADNRELYYLVIGLCVLIVMLIFAILSRIRSRKKINDANDELVIKNNELKSSYQLISESNAKNETLLKELHHRVKNNLQMISSLFNLQLNAQELDTEATGIFRAAQDRIHSISLIHKKIYQSDNVSTLDFGDYLLTFSKEIKHAYKVSPEINIDLPEVTLSIDSAIPLGLIFNELFTNSLKHAKNGKDLKITISKKVTSSGLMFIYTDNGVGIDPSMMKDDSKNSIGITLIHLLSEQLDAETRFKAPKQGEYGFFFSIEGDFN
ncbi:MAG: sensor histidine kinase [Vicingaceae bacterium]